MSFRARRIKSDVQQELNAPELVSHCRFMSGTEGPELLDPGTIQGECWCGHCSEPGSKLGRRRIVTGFAGSGAGVQRMAFWDVGGLEPGTRERYAAPTLSRRRQAMM